MARVKEKFKNWFIVELDEKDTPDDLEIPFSELAMHMGVAGTKGLKIKELECHFDPREGKKGEIYASGVRKARMQDRNGRWFDSHGLVSELVPFDSPSEPDVRGKLDRMCKVAFDRSHSK